jgi:hypothetical protein
MGARGILSFREYKDTITLGFGKGNPDAGDFDRKAESGY